MRWISSNGLAGFKRGSTTVTILYDVEGQPVGFTVNDAVYTYVYNGSQLMQMTCGSDTLNFTYGAIGPTMEEI